MASPAMFNFLKPRVRLQKADITAAATWGFAAGATAIWLVQVQFVSSSYFAFFSGLDAVLAIDLVIYQLSLDRSASLHSCIIFRIF